MNTIQPGDMLPPPAPGEPIEAMGRCAICIINRGDRSEKLVKWCGTCSKWRCEKCRGAVVTQVAPAVARHVTHQAIKTIIKKRT